MLHFSLLGNVLGHVALHQAALEVLQSRLNVLTGQRGRAHNRRLDAAHPRAEEAAARLPIRLTLLPGANCLLILLLVIIICESILSVSHLKYLALTP